MEYLEHQKITQLIKLSYINTFEDKGMNQELSSRKPKILFKFKIIFIIKPYISILLILVIYYFIFPSNVIVPVSWRWESKTRVTSSNLRVTSSNPRVKRLKAKIRRLKTRIGGLKNTSWGIKSTN